MNILVIIVTYNAMQWAERCFNSLKNSSIVPDIFVVDNGSTDGTQAFIQNHFPEVLFHQSETNLGFGKANNLGLQFALDKNYDYVYLLNQDAWVMEDTFEKLIDISQRYPEYGILSPFQMNADLIHIDRNFVANVLSWKSNPDIVSDIYSQKYKDVYPVNAVMAAHWLITRHCLETVGGFSPSFSHYSEDYNYADRVYYWQMKVGIVPLLKVIHDRGWRETTSEKRMYLAYTSSIRLLSKPQTNTMRAVVKVFYLCIKNLILYKSFRPIYYLWNIIKDIRFFIKNRIVSMSDKCAFLYSSNI